MLCKQIKSNYEASGGVNRGGRREDVGDDDFDWRVLLLFPV